MFNASNVTLVLIFTIILGAIGPRAAIAQDQAESGGGNTMSVQNIPNSPTQQTMKVGSFYPVIGTNIVQETVDFYLEHFQFETTFEADWYMSLRLASDPSVELAVLDYSHPSVPGGYRKPVQGLLLNFEVEDVDNEYERLKSAGLPIDLELRDEDWGQRHFITHDPNGVLIDVIRVTAPSEQYENQYKE